MDILAAERLFDCCDASSEQIVNLFFIDRDPVTCAHYHCNKHVVKLVIETAQMLSCAHQVFSPVHIDGLYRKTHVNHPSTRWVREAPLQYRWAYDLFAALCTEYTHRYDRKHLSERLLPLLHNPPMQMNNGSTYWSDPPLCMPDVHKQAGDAVACYRDYYKVGKKHLHDYKRREMPEWLL